jgi:asparagine synthase (glutamine-hydrolysing)
VGPCLSGGLDSSSIVCVASAQLTSADPAARIRVFSARSEDPRIDEGRYIDEIVKVTRAEAHAVYPTGADFVDGLERVVWHQEEPFHAPSVFAQYEVMRLARETGVTVLLDGQAGDELFAGYYYFVPPYLADLARRCRWRRLVREWSGHCSLHGVAGSSVGRDVLRAVLPESVARIIGSAVNGRRSAAETACLGPTLGGLVATRRSTVSDGRDLLHSALRYATLRSPLPNYLHHEDRNSMAWSIEARTPFLDYRLVEYVTQLPGQYKISSGWTKSVLRDAMEGVLPEVVRMRADKQGFSTPQAEWFRGEARDLLRDLLIGEPSRRRGWVDQRWARRTADDLVEGRLIDEGVVWRCASLELWARVMLDRPLHLLLEPPSATDRPGAVDRLQRRSQS